MNSDRFTADDNAPGYTSADLKARNAAFQATCDDADLPTQSDDPQLASMRDQTAEKILEWYDEGRQGNLIIRWKFTGFKRVVL
jgi:hypothetical protein